ncbi:MAG: hypothetical protein IPM39_26860 [Chloroflexi bacterium]|nr:hypothetical protein [Chloroflexota bacterium]
MTAVLRLSGQWQATTSHPIIFLWGWDNGRYGGSRRPSSYYNKADIHG